MSDYPVSVPAILALQRFVRRIVKQVGLSVISLLLVLGLTTHPSVTPSGSQTAAQSQLTHMRSQLSTSQMDSHHLQS